MAIKAKKVGLYAFYVFHFLVILAAIILYGIFAKQHCKVTSLDNEDCSSLPTTYKTVINTIVATVCEHIVEVKIENSIFPVQVAANTYVNLALPDVHFYCAWYKRDVGIGETALALGLVHLFVLIASKIKSVKKKIPLVARLATGALAAAFLLIATILTWRDLFDENTHPEYSGWSWRRGGYIANVVLVTVAFFCATFLTAKDGRKLLRKGKGFKQVAKVTDSSPQAITAQDP